MGKNFVREIWKSPYFPQSSSLAGRSQCFLFLPARIAAQSIGRREIVHSCTWILWKELDRACCNLTSKLIAPRFIATKNGHFQMWEWHGWLHIPFPSLHSCYFIATRDGNIGFLKLPIPLLLSPPHDHVKMACLTSLIGGHCESWQNWIEVFRL